MKKIMIIVLAVCQAVAYAQSDSVKSSQFLNHVNSAYPKAGYPKTDGLIYNQQMGETYDGYRIANGWRKDTINGGYNKDSDYNFYISELRFVKQGYPEKALYRYQNGKLFSGLIADTFRVTFTQAVTADHLSEKRYYEGKDLTVIFRANCVKGLLQGKGVLYGIVPQYSAYGDLPLSECNFINGEIVGICRVWDLNSIKLKIEDGKIYSDEKEPDYNAFRKKLDVSEITYAKGNSDYVKYITYERNKNTGEVKRVEQKITTEKTKKR